MSKVEQTHYEVLGVTPSASQKQIREAFVRLSKQVSLQTLHEYFTFVYYLFHANSSWYPSNPDWSKIFCDCAPVSLFVCISMYRLGG